jgi:phosphoribosyl 1,2-cyclic phosphate phosphodiesterase
VALQIEFLGTAGAITTPRPGCRCRVCAQAREKGVPYSRAGPSLFVHGPDVLIDTPEEIKDELNRSRVTEVPVCFYSHWHPDHVMGRRLFETMNQDWRGWPVANKRTDVYLPEQVAADFRTRLGSWDHLAFMERQGAVRLIVMRDGDAVELNGARIRPFRLAAEYVYAFLFEDGAKRVLIAPDELVGWEPPAWLRGVDLAVLPMGVVEHDPFTGERRIPADHPVLGFEATFAQTLGMVERLGAGRTILTHIEEPDGLTFDDLQRLERRLKGGATPVEFAYDTMFVRVA